MAVPGAAGGGVGGEAGGVGRRPEPSLTYDAQELSAEIEQIPLDDPRLREAWGEMHRVVLKARGKVKEGVGDR